MSYWNVFNVEGESQVGADIVTYATLTDMLSDANRTGVLTLDGAGVNVVGSGAWASESPVIIPIPASFLLLASAFAGFAGHRMRRQHK